MGQTGFDAPPRDGERMMCRFTDLYAAVFGHDGEVEIEREKRWVICRWNDPDGLRREEVVRWDAIFATWVSTTPPGEIEVVGESIYR